MIALEALFIVICIIGEAFFSGIETGIISIRRLRLKHHQKKGDSAAEILTYFQEDTNRLLGTTLVGTNICIVVTSVLAADISTRLVGPGGEIISAFIVTVVLLLFAEYLPKAWFRARPYVRSARFAKLLRICWTVLRPIAIVVTWIADLIVPRTANKKRELYALADRGELKLLADEGEKHGVLTSEERAMIHRTVELAEKPAQSIMTPLKDIVAVESTSSAKDFISIARKHEYLRFPVIERKNNTFLGTVEVLDVLSHSDLESRSIREFIKNPVFIAGSTPSDEIMPTLRLARQSMGLVTDKNINVIGLVTSDDILRQIILGD